MTREHYGALLRELDTGVLKLGGLVTDTIGESIQALEQRDVELAQRLIAADSLIDESRYDIENRALLLIATQQPLAGDLRTVAAILTVATELERIGDYCEGISKLTLRMAAEPVHAPVVEIRGMAGLTQQLLNDVMRAYSERDLEAAGRVWMQDDEVDDLYERVFRHLIAVMIADRTTVREGTYLLWVAHNLERIADRVTNIAERIAFIVTGDVATFRDELRAQTLPT